MNVELRVIKKEEESVLQILFQFYKYEFSIYLNTIKVNSAGLFEKENFENYWEKSNYHPFFIVTNNELVGFALIKEGIDKEPNTIEQFFILNYYAGKGIGKIIVKQIFDRFRGEWKVLQISNNYSAQAFWRKVISEYTDDNYTEYYDQEDDRCSVQVFQN